MEVSRWAWRTLFAVICHSPMAEISYWKNLNRTRWYLLCFSPVLAKLESSKWTTESPLIKRLAQAAAWSSLSKNTFRQLLRTLAWLTIQFYSTTLSMQAILPSSALHLSPSFAKHPRGAHGPTPSEPPFKGRYLEEAPRLRLEFGCQTKFKTTSERNYLYHKGIRRMETNRQSAHAASECAASDGLGDVEFWDGDGSILWAQFCFE